MSHSSEVRLRLQFTEDECKLPGGLGVELSHIANGYCIARKSTHAIAAGTEATLHWWVNGHHEWQCGYLPEGLAMGEYVRSRFVPYLGG